MSTPALSACRLTSQRERESAGVLSLSDRQRGCVLSCFMEKERETGREREKENGRERYKENGRERYKENGRERNRERQQQ